MSRLIVKNLPPNCTEASLRSFFKSHGSLTDCTLKYTKEGKFRKFAFVGFEDDDAAGKAISRTNETYMGASRLVVEECKPFGDSNKPRAWSKYSTDSSAYKRKLTDGTPSSKEGESSVSEPSKKKKKDDPEFSEFLQAKGVEVAAEEPTYVDADDAHSKLLEELMTGIEGDTRLSLLFIGLPSSIKQNSLKEWLSPVRVKAMKIVRNEKEAAAFVTFNRPPDVRRAQQRDREFLGGFKITIQKVDAPKAEGDCEDEQMGEQGERESKYDTGTDRSTEESKIREEILDTGRLFLRNLPFTTKEDDVRAIFKKYGELSDVQVIISKATGLCKGFAIVEYVFPECAVAAYAAHDGKVFKGRMLHIIPGSEKREKADDDNAEGANDEKKKFDEKSSFKKEKMAKLKANAGKAHSWNALFLGPNAIADTLAEKLGVEKADLLLGGSGESAGVRLALAETRLVRETRDFLIANGIKLDAFSRPSTKRSDTVILAKNLPSGLSSEELTRMFERFGAVTKVLIPPEGGVSALILMGNTVDAKKAFKGLAYSRFRTQPLYLEWAPVDVFGEPVNNDDSEVKEESTAVQDETPVKEKSKKKKKDIAKGAEENEESEIKAKNEEVEKPSDAPQEETSAEDKPNADDGIDAGVTVFVKNLAFDTTDESLSAFFSQKYRIKSAQISKKLNPIDPSKNLSMGFGFVQFFTDEEAKEAIKKQQGQLLDGHCLELKMSNREVVDKAAFKRKGVSSKEQGQSTKLIVRNLPFQASIKEITSLFSTFGEIRNIRIPKKLGSSDQHRGFGFVDFLSVGEAKRAFEALVHSTHLYGRRLVLEWANDDETVEELREKTAEKFSGDRKANKKQRQQILDIEKDLTKVDEE